MGLLDWFRPKWRHSDAAVRRDAIEALGEHESAALERVARSDPAPALRRLALERTLDEDLLRERMNDETDAGVAAYARQRLGLPALKPAATPAPATAQTPKSAPAKSAPAKSAPAKAPPAKAPPAKAPPAKAPPPVKKPAPAPSKPAAGAKSAPATAAQPRAAKSADAKSKKKKKNKAAIPAPAPTPATTGVEVMSVEEAERRFGAMFQAASPVAASPEAPQAPEPLADEDAITDEAPARAEAAEPQAPRPPRERAPRPERPRREAREPDEGRGDDGYLDWVVLPRFEELLTRADAAIAGAETRQIAAARKALIEEWRALGHPPGAQAEALRAGRDARLDALSARLTELRGAQDQALTGNLEIKEEILARVEAAITLDPRAISDAMRGFVAEWRAAGPVPRAEVDALGARYKAAMDALHARRLEARAAAENERKRRLEQLAAVVATAEALTTARDVRAAADRARGLMASWKSVGPTGPRAEVEALWQRYRAACDVIFERRGAAESGERATAVARKEALIARALALAESGDVSDPDTVIRDLKNDWRKAGYAPRAESDALWARFRAACDRISSGQRVDLGAAGDASSLVFHPFAALRNDEKD